MPAGTYILFARVQAVNNSLQSAAFGSCSIPGDEVDFVISNEYSQESLALTSSVIHPGGAIELRCEPGDTTFTELWVGSAKLTGVKVDTLN